MTAAAFRSSPTDPLGRGIAWWHKALGGAPGLVDLPADRLRPTLRTPGEVGASTELGSEISRGVALLADRAGVSPEAVLLGALQVLLARYGAGNDLVVGVRTGCVFPLRVAVPRETSFTDLVRTTAAAWAECAAQPVSLAALAESPELGGGPGVHPVFQVLFSATADGTAPLTAPLLPGRAPLDLALRVAIGADRIGVVLAGSGDLFEQASIDRMLRHWTELLAAGVTVPATRVADLRMMAADEAAAVCAAWDATATPYPLDRCLHQLIADVCRARPQAVALEGQDETLTYAELDHRAAVLGTVLRGLGVGPDVRVGLCLERSPAQIVAIYAILKAGGAYVPLDPRYPADRLAFMAADAGLALVVTHSALQVPGLDGVRTLYVDRPLPEAATPAEAPPHLAEQLAYVIYTSGSTGVPKGAGVPHRAAVNLVLSTMERLGWSEADRTLQFNTVNFDISVCDIFCSLLAGGTLVLRTDAMLDSMRAFLEQCAAWRITLLNLPTAFWHEIAAGVGNDGLPLPATVRAAIGAGERMLPDRAAALRAAARPGVGLWNGYGPTEATVYATLHEVRGSAEEIAARPVPIGGPLANVRCYVLDAERRPVPFGVPGELYVGGVGVARGYLNRPELTAERFVPDPHASEPGAPMYRTGDRVRLLPDGVLEYLGRLDDQVKIRGFRVELGEVEYALRQHPAVRDCAAMAREDVAGDRRLVAYVVAAEGPAPRAVELRAFLRRSVPEFLVPSAIVAVPALPVNANGKVDRRALPAPSPADYADDAYEPPAPGLETTLAGIFAEVLGRPRMGATEHFFEAGGHSLLAMRVLGRVAAATGVRLALRVMFEAPTPRHLAERLDALLRESSGAAGDPMAAVPRRGRAVAGLTPDQEMLWVLQRTTPELTAYNIPTAWRLTGPLDLAALRHALDQLAARHPALRTRIESNVDEFVQRVDPPAPAPFRVTDLSGAAEPAAAGRALVDREAATPFDLTAEWPIRAHLIRLAADDHFLIVTIHHLASDGWTQAVVLEELSQLYAAAVRGTAAALPAPPVTYTDCAEWMHDRLSPERLEPLLGFWRQELAGAPELLELPLDRPRPAAPTFAGRQQRAVLGRPLVDALRAMAQQEDATLFMVLVAAFHAVLHRYGGQGDIATGSTVARRLAPETERVVGFFSGVVLLRSSFAGDPTFRELVRQVRERTIAALSHQEAPLELVAQQWHGRRNAALPLLQAAVSLHNTESVELALPGIEVAGLEIGNGQAKFELELAFTERVDGLHALLEYRTELFDDATMERLLQHVATLFAAAAHAPDTPASALPLLTEAERRQLLVEWNDTAAPPAERMAHGLFEAQVRRSPGAVAVISGTERGTYRELNDRADRVARALGALGVRPGTLVGLLVERSPDLLTGLLGVLKAGGAYLPLDPEYPADRLAYMVGDAEPAVLLTQSALAARLPECDCPILFLDALPPDSAPTPDAPASGPDDPAYVIYTSGSTGWPKGVVVPHRALSNLLASMAARPGLEAGDVLLAVTTLSFDIAGLELLGPLVSGGAVVVASRDTARDGGSLAALLADTGATVMQATPATWRLLLAAGWQGSDRLRIWCGGEALPADLAEALLPRCAELWNLYGPTETTIWSTVHRVTDPGEAGCIGRPIANTRLYLLDARRQPVPVGVPGELYIGGAGVALGYRNRPDLTAERFPADPFAGAPGAWMYRTGDRARWGRDGTVWFMGRLDHQVKIRGFRVELGEIETALREHPAVADAAVELRPARAGDARLVAYYAAAQPIEPAELRQLLRRRLPEYMMPAHFVPLAHLPLTANGKLDRAALPDAEPEAAADGRWTPPRGWLERELAAIWEELLGVSPIGANDSFFELGGHSLLAARMLARVGDLLGRRMPLATLLEHPTIAYLAASLLEAKSPETLIPLRTTGTRPPIFWCHGDVYGGGLYCPALGRQLELGVPVYALSPHPTTGPATIELMAADYAARIRQVQPKGPYRLGGFCYGGLLAFATARVLEAEGETVELLAMVDTYGENVRLAFLHDLIARLGRRLGVPEGRVRRWWIDQHERLVRHTTGLPLLDPRPSAMAAAAYLLRFGVRVGVATAGAALRRLRGLTASKSDDGAAPVLAERDLVRDAEFYEDTIRTYIPRPIQGGMLLIWTEAVFNSLGADRTGSWKGVGRSEVCVVPGDHVSILTRHIGDLAAAINERLRILDSGRTPPQR